MQVKRNLTGLDIKLQDSNTSTVQCVLFSFRMSAVIRKRLCGFYRDTRFSPFQPRPHLLLDRVFYILLAEIKIQGH